MASFRHNKRLEKVLLAGLPAFLGNSLLIILSLLAADIFNESIAVADEGDGNQDKIGAFAQLFSICNAALELASVVGSSSPRLF